MTERQNQIVNGVIDDAFDALPNADERELTDWIMRNRYPSLPFEVKEAVALECLEEMIRESARKLGTELRE